MKSSAWTNSISRQSLVMAKARIWLFSPCPARVIVPVDEETPPAQSACRGSPVPRRDDTCTCSCWKVCCPSSSGQILEEEQGCPAQWPPAALRWPLCWDRPPPSGCLKPMGQPELHQDSTMLWPITAFMMFGSNKSLLFPICFYLRQECALKLCNCSTVIANGQKCIYLFIYSSRLFPCCLIEI